MSATVEQRINPADLPAACKEVLRKGGRMQMAYAWYPEPDAAPEILYLADQGPHEPFLTFRCALPSLTTHLPSLAAVSPLLGWYEREIRDLFGVEFEDSPEPYPLVLHEGATPPFPPLDPRYQPAEVMPFVPSVWRLPEIQGQDVQRLPFGPIRADVLETAQIVFYYVGEAILHCHPQLFFKHRGMEKRFEGLTPDMGVLLAERVSGVGSVAHSLAFCQAVEEGCDCVAPLRAQYLRVILAELERLYNHLHYLGHLCHTTTLKVGEAEGKLLEERAKQINSAFTGSRFLRSLLTPGGLRRDIDVSGLGRQLDELKIEIDGYTVGLERTNSHLDRLMTTGPLPQQVAFDEGATGPIKRASGIDRDLRRDHPYAAYGLLNVRVPVKTDGDAHARAQVRMEEIDSSIDLIQQALAQLPVGSIRAEVKIRQGAEGLGWTESPRGTIYYAVHFTGPGRLARVKVKSPSFSNWRVFPFTVHDTNMMDYAINEASFGLTMAGCDR
ncbi:MAG TPA: NADH-quinone oxidoreductase subunit C [Bryobacteraceae bacterium]|nr:NADH-quinone oxidoreductase subunit C [Bryobacteraceae bacterium]